MSGTEHFVVGRSVLITGVNGFLGKCVVESLRPYTPENGIALCGAVCDSREQDQVTDLFRAHETDIGN